MIDAMETWFAILVAIALVMISVKLDQLEKRVKECARAQQNHEGAG